MKTMKRIFFLAILTLSACLNVACSNSASPPVPVSAPPAPATVAGQPNPPAATDHDHSAHELENNMPRVTALDLMRLMETRRAVLIDVRSAEEYRLAHIQGAINLPLQQIEAGQTPNLPRDKRLISYCT